MPLSPAELDAQFASASTLVETVLAKIGLDPKALRSKSEADLASWTLQRGSAAVLISVSKGERGDGVFLRVISPVMTLPAEGRLALFTRLLELNAKGLVNAAFGLVGDRVVATSERPVAGLDVDEVDQIVRHLSAVADTYDDRLVREFGGKRASDASAG